MNRNWEVASGRHCAHLADMTQVDLITHRAARRALSTRSGKVTALFAGGAGMALGGLMGSWTIAIIGAGVFLFVVWPRLESRWRRIRLMRRAIGRAPMVGDPVELERTLGAIGLEGDHKARLFAHAAEGDVVLGTFRQDDYLVTSLDLGGGLVTVGEIGDEVRARHDVQLVVNHRWLCVRKEYRPYRDRPRQRLWFAQEVAALEQLRDLEDVPDLILATTEPLVAYMSFMSGPSLANLLVEAGFTLKDQLRIRGVYPGPGQWPSDASADLQRRSKEIIRSQIGEEGLHKLRDLIERIHDRGVILGDVKCGNVIVRERGPALIDFDLAIVHRPGSATLSVAREREMDLCSYLFGFD
jgi:hypothetical protein